MRVSLEWLREFVRVGASLEVLVERLAGLGFPVEHVERMGEDTILEIELTSNRPDCMSVRGIAREVGLLGYRRLRPPAPKPVERRDPSSARIAVKVAAPDGCPRFTARVIEGVRVGPSPAWAQRRLEASGIRAINNVVDVTNYVMLELGQPMHAFDYDRIAGGRLVVRRAERGESLTTLDGVTRTLDSEMLVVADAERVVSLAGIIGGGATEIGARTGTVLLEAAYWHPPTIGRTARRLGIRTEASARFERGMDPAAPPQAQDRAAALLGEWCGGRILRGMVDVYPKPLRPRGIRLRPKRAAAVLGVEIPKVKMTRILRSLGCTVTDAATLRVRPPSFRPDLVREEDLIEEVARIHGYDRIPPTMPRGASSAGTVAPALRADARVRETLARLGLTEVMTLTLVPPQAEAHGRAVPVVLQNPLLTDQAALRTSLLPGLANVLASNAARRVEDVQVFELGRVFRDAGRDARPLERRALGIAMMGRWRTGWNIPPDLATVDFFHLKGVLEALLREVGVRGWGMEAPPPRDPQAGSGPPWWHPARAAILTLGGSAIGRFGELHADPSAARRLPHRAYLAEVDLDALLAAAAPPGTSPNLPRYPAVERDIAVVSPLGTPAAQVEGAIHAAAGPLLEAVVLFDVYTGPPVPPGHRNLAYRLRLRAHARTLTAEEAEEIVQRVRIALQERVGVQLRE
ncbi:MAG TPA: phenylalanine--tRNA ligase subunit beta [bacterium]|nr:phenylalanine--tRNA ligase subunit beta [bacterium]